MSEGRAQIPAVRTFLIADIRGYTAFTREHGDEAASRLARKFADVAREGITAWTGELVELRGDEALAVFDSPRRALRAAVELQAAFGDETAREPEWPLTVGIGLDAGEAVPVGEGYRGAALNTAARLCSVAGVGHVIASAGLVHLAGPTDGLTYAPREPVVAKGFEEPIAAFAIGAPDGRARPHAVTAHPAPGPLPPELDPIVPLCGRSAELDWLSWHLRRARHGSGRAVVVSGPPGIGKTRLAAEVATRARGAATRVVYLPAGRTANEQPLAELAAVSAPTLIVVDDLDAAPASFAEAVGRLDGDWLAARPLLLLITHRREAPPSLISLAAEVASPERHLRLQPLDSTGVRAIAALYAGAAIDEVPLGEIIDRSAGVPAAVHRVASHVAGALATRRLGASADRTRIGRQDLRAAEAELIDQVAGVGLVRERTQLFAVQAEDADELAICPYKGLESFEATDAEYYFGRERLVAELVARLVGASFLGLVGASGSGKSSALRAGLLPALGGGVLPGSDGWSQVLLRPGEHPLRELAASLSRAPGIEEAQTDHDPAGLLDAALAGLPSGARLLLVVDQFEEIFNATRDEEERLAFVELLSRERTGLKVLVSLRADHYGRCAAYPDLARAIGANHVLVGPLSSSELAAAIERPAQKVGLRVESELTEALIDDIGAEPGALPLLSTAMLELWQARDGRRLTLASYRATRGVRGAVARLAESAFGALDDDQRAIARSIFLRLAGPGEGEGVVRRRVPLVELDVDRDPSVATVLAVLTDARLLTTGDGYVEVAHEALLREWPRLQQWLADDAAGRELRLHLTAAAREWDAHGREAGELYRGARLAAALDWAATREVELNATEREYLAASRAEAEREIERQRRTNRRLRALLAGAAVFLVLAVAAGAFAGLQLQRAEEAGALARSHELAAYSVAFVDDDPVLSKLLALSAATTVEDPPLETIAALHQAWAADRMVGRYEWPADEPTDLLSADLDPSGRYVAATQQLGYLEVRDITNGELLWSVDHGDGLRTWLPTFSPDGTMVAAGVSIGADPPAGSSAPGGYVWDAMSGEQLHHFDMGPCGGDVNGFSGDRLLLARLAGSPPDCWDSAAVLISLEWVDLSTGAREDITAHSLGGHMSGDGRLAAFEEFSGDRPTSRVVELTTGETVLTLDQRDETTQFDRYARALSPDGSMLLYGDRPLHVYEVATGELVGSYDGHAGETISATFSSDGDSVISIGRDASLHEWTAHGGEQRGVYPGVGTGRVEAVEATVLVSDEDRGLAWLVAPGPKAEVELITTCDSRLVYAGSLSIRAGVGAVAQDDCDGAPVTYVIDVAAGQVTDAIADHTAQGLALSPDGSRLLRQSGDGSMVHRPAVIDIASGAETPLEGVCSWDTGLAQPPYEQEGCRPFPDQPFPLWSWRLAWSPDGSMVAAVDAGPETGFFVVWDAASGALLHASTPRMWTWDVTFTPDSERLIVSHGGDQPSLTAYSTSTWRPLVETEFDGDVTFVGFADEETVIGLSGYAGSGGGALHWIDTGSLTAEGSSIARIHDGSPKSFSMSPDRSLVATGASDGFVRVWSVQRRALVHEFRIGKEQVQGVAFVNDRHLAVAPQSGHIFVYTLDPGELIEFVRRSILRSFSDLECERFNFGAECPTLDDLRGQ